MTASPGGAFAISDALRLPPGPIDLAALDTRACPGYPGTKKDQPELMAALAPVLADRQERLFAAGRTDPERAPRVLVVLQGMDTAGKGGVVRHAVGLVDPQGVRITGFGAPTAEELRHDFLWRIERALPPPGIIGIFDRSHYEDVLIARVESLVSEAEWRARYERINAFEARLAAGGTRIIKCFLNVSYAKQGERLLERLDDPDKHWKYDPSDLAGRRRWADYQQAYADALARCNSDAAPWYVVPADRKWYRNWAVAQLLAEQLAALDLGWPAADYDVAEQRRELAATL